MKLHDWVVALVMDCTSYRPDATDEQEVYSDQRYQTLNSMYAMGWLAGDRSAQLARQSVEKLVLEGLGRTSGYVSPMVSPKVCGHTANWLCRMMAGSDQPKVPPVVTDSALQMRSTLQTRNADRHHLLRVDSKPLGHAYVLYLPPTAREPDAYYHYQTNINEQMPELSIEAWIAEESKCTKQGDVGDHVAKLAELDVGMTTVLRKWVIDTFTLLDSSNVTFDSEGHFTGGQLALGTPPTGRVGHRFTLYVLDPEAFKKNIGALYIACGLDDPSGMLTLDD